MKDHREWYAVQEGSFDWDSEDGCGVFVLATSPQTAAVLGFANMPEKSSCDGMELKVAKLDLQGFTSVERVKIEDKKDKPPINCWQWENFRTLHKVELTPRDLCNLALERLGCKKIERMDEASLEAQECRRLLPQVYSGLETLGPWADDAIYTYLYICRLAAELAIPLRGDTSYHYELMGDFFQVNRMNKKLLRIQLEMRQLQLEKATKND